VTLERLTDMETQINNSSRVTQWTEQETYHSTLFSCNPDNMAASPTALEIQLQPSNPSLIRGGKDRQLHYLLSVNTRMESRDGICCPSRENESLNDRACIYSQKCPTHPGIEPLVINGHGGRVVSWSVINEFMTMYLSNAISVVHRLVRKAINSR